MRYIDLMGGQKPHLLIKTTNNLGAETQVEYAPSTKFYLQDKQNGKPWITKLPFPVHVVERVKTYDYISRNRFVTRYAYHDGYFDGEEREFRGFGCVEQWDTEELAALTGDNTMPPDTNTDASSHVPPVRTVTWFHTGAFLEGEKISQYMAHEYYGAPDENDPDYDNKWKDFETTLLPDTIPPETILLADGTRSPHQLTVAELREACRDLKGSILRQEVYAEDKSPKAPYPYTVSERNYTIELLQPHESRNRHAVLFTHPREAITYHYEHNPADPRIQHAMTLEVDAFGNVPKEAAIGYGRRMSDASLPTDEDREKQTRPLVTYTENRVAKDPVTGVIDTANDYRTPLPCETRTYELTGFKPENKAARFSFDEWTRNGFALPASATEIPYEQTADNVSKQKRLIEHVRTLYRKDDLTALLPLGELEPLALPGESYKLAFTPGLLAQVFQRNGQPLLPNPANVLGGQGTDRGGYVVSQGLKVAGDFPNNDPDDHWWIPAGRVFLSPDSTHTAAQERAYAQSHFFLPHRYRDPFLAESVVTYDAYDLLMLETHDPLGNRVTVGERLPDGTIDPTKPGNDYRVLQPWRVMDPNRNHTQVAFDTLGMVMGTAVMGKPEENLGDSLAGFEADLTEAVVLTHLANPLVDPHAILGRATTRLVYDLFAYQRTKNQPKPQPAVVYTLARETHDADLEPGQQTKVQHSFSHSDGFGREIQKKIQAEPETINGVAGPPRWVGSGWTIFNNKGKPVRQYEPFFSTTHRFEFGVQVGVSPILFYDPVERVVATLHPNHTYEKVVFDPWQQTTWDVNDTVLGDPRTDADIRGYTAGYFASLPAPPWQTWHAQRQGGALGAQEQAAADKAAAHADTPTTVHFDMLGRPFLTVAHNKVVCPNHALDGTEDKFHTRVELDIEGNQRAVRDAIEQAGDPQGRIVMHYDYDVLGNRIHQASMEAGARWMLNDVTGKPIRAWDRRGHSVRTEYDRLRRPLRSFVTGANPANPNQEMLTERLVYGEQHPEAELCNLRGKLYLHLDQAGAVTSEAHDFKGNPLRASRRLTNGTQYRQAVDWRAVDADHVALPMDAKVTLDPVALEAALAPLLEADPYTSRTTYDALNRPVTLTTPHMPAMQPSVIQPDYNEANLLERVDVNLRGGTANGQPVWTPFVTNIDYNAKGQRTLIGYGDGVRTIYEYDPLTFRLTHLLTRRNAIVFPDDCPQPPMAGWPGCQVQNLRYTYDPAGNITHIRDDAQQTIYFRNKRVEPSAEYTYDAIYRLLKATGREHEGQVGQPWTTYNDAGRVDLPHPHDGQAMRTYTEQYDYDPAGNILKLTHHATNGDWVRAYEYEAWSLLEPNTKKNNRLTRTVVHPDSQQPIPEPYVHDAHGNMTQMPQLVGMQWDFKDQLQMTRRQRVNDQDDNGKQHEGERTWYVYDSAGQRVRKVTETGNGTKKKEQIYLGGFEIYREYNGNASAKLERETLHIMDDKQRIALVETKTVENSQPLQNPQTLQRYQFSNHLGSASLELDDQAQIISYEEYTPYGSTSYQAVRRQTETPKRYRFTGKEQEESGLYYHGARYYAAWIQRWTSVDPVQSGGEANGYCYVKSNPTRYYDPTGKAASEQPSLLRQLWIRFVASRNLELGSNSVYREAIVKASQRTGIEPSAIATIIHAEAAPLSGSHLNAETDREFYMAHPELSGHPIPANNKELIKEWQSTHKALSTRWDPESAASTSGALGLTQFLASTWISEAKREGTNLNREAVRRGYVVGGEVVPQNKAKLLAIRTDPLLSIVAAAEYDRHELDRLVERLLTAPANDPQHTRERAETIRDLPDDLKARFYYLVHHEGSEGAERVLRRTLTAQQATVLYQANVGQGPVGNPATAYVDWLWGYIHSTIRPEEYRKRESK